VGAYQKFIPNLGKLAAPLNTLATLSKPEFDKHIMIKENQIIISDTIRKIKSIITAGLCLALSHKNIGTFIFRTDPSISEWVQH
jgi:hypothetical protein